MKSKIFDPYKKYMMTSHREAEMIPEQKHKTPAKPHTTEHQTVISRTTGLPVEISMGMPGDGKVPKNPFASKAQQRFMFAAEARGDVPKGTAKRWAHHTKSIKSLPEKVSKKK